MAYNGKPIRNRDELVSMVTATKPGTTVPLRVVRDRQERTISVTVEELDLDAEASARRSDNRGGSGNPPEETTSGFGVTLGNITPEVAQRLRLDRGVRARWSPTSSRAARRRAPASRPATSSCASGARP